MKQIFLDLGMGAAGDMLAAALYELLDEQEKVSFIEKMNSLGLDGVRVRAQKSTKCGITGTHMEVTVDGVSEIADDVHHHDQEHHHDHHEHYHEHHDEHEKQIGHHHEHADRESISRIIQSMPFSDSVKRNVSAVYDIIAAAESRAHSVPVSQIHFHEVGTKDAVADITAVCLLMEMLDADKVTASPVRVGFGQVRCAHGILPVPAPATADILSGVPMYAGDIEGELCTPTGAALVKHFADVFGNMPMMSADRIGYGMGMKDFEAVNCVRAILGSSVCTDENVVRLSCNIDDMTGESLGYASAELLRKGAKDVYTIPAGMKKSRPGIILNVICDTADREKFVSLMFKLTSTIGIREEILKRYVLDRSIKKVITPYGEVRIKVSEGYGVIRKKAEYDDLCKIAEENGLSIDDASALISRETDHGQNIEKD